MKRQAYLLILICLCSCGKETPPGPPAVTSLVFPTQNLDCTQGDLLNAATRIIPFQWNVAKDAESYELQVTQLSSGQITRQTTLLNSLEIPLKMGEAYAWKVVAANTKVLESTPSALWYFFNAGAQTTHAPFPATALSPLSGSQLAMPLGGQLSLRWSGADIDNDIARYSLLIGSQNPPTDIQNLSSPTTTQFTQDVIEGQTYYWQIITEDQAGNKTPSPVFDFKIKE